jgi:hypothetical protein
LFDTGRADKLQVSWQLAPWTEFDDYGYSDNNITFGGNVEQAYDGSLKFNFILEESAWLWNINFQGVAYDGIRIPRNESFIYGSVDPMIGVLAISYVDFLPLRNNWKNIPGITCDEDLYEGYDACAFHRYECRSIM